MLSWHNDPALKAEVVERMREHRRQDRIIQGTYQDHQWFGAYRGCFIGCTLPYLSQAYKKSMDWQGWRHEVEVRYGIPSYFVYGMEQIFEGLTDGSHGDFAVQLIEAIPVGVDLEPVCEKFMRDYNFSWDLRYQAPIAREHLFRALAEATPKPELVPPLIQHIDIPEPEPILIRVVVNN